MSQSHIMKKKYSYLQLGKFFPPDWGGIETVTYNLLMGLTEQGIKNAAIAFGDFNEVKQLSSGENIAEIYRVNHVKFFGAPASLRYLFIFKKIAADYNVVIVHLPNPMAAICLALSGYKGRVALYWHSDIINKGLLGRLLVPLERWLIARADVVLGPTSAHLKYSRYAPLLLAKGGVAPYPIESCLVSVAESRREMPRTITAKRAIRILAIGRLVEYKGLEYLVRAIPQLLSKHEIRVDILGDGPLRGQLDSLIVELGLAQHVLLHGAVSEDKKNNFLIEADIFCFPSVTKQEMYGMSQIEAMAHGLPIISTDIFGSGTPELIRTTGTGLVISPSSVEEIRSAIQRLIDDPVLYSNLSNAGLNAITHIFKPSVLIKNFCQLCNGS
jgi:glycosyltransferase involved in cell wall biosynthesis